MSHLGIELRVSIGDEVLLLADSVRLHLIAKFGGQTDDWFDVFNPVNGPTTMTTVYIGGAPVLVPIPLKIEIKAVELSDPADYERNEEEERDDAAQCADQEAEAGHG